MKQLPLVLLVVTTSMSLVAGCSRTSNAPAPVAKLTDGSLTEQDAAVIRDQIVPCWNFPAGVELSENYRVAVEIEVTPEGKVTKWTVNGDSSRLNDPNYMRALQQAVKAVKDPACQPLHFPPGKYWPSLVIVFDPKSLQ